MRVRNRLGTDLTAESPVSAGELAAIRTTLNATATEVTLGVVRATDAAYGAVGDGSTDDTAALTAAIAAADAGSSKVVLLPGGTYRTTDLTVPAGVTLWIPHGAKFTVDAGQTLTISGKIDAGLYQIFSGSGSVVFSGSSVPRVFPQWWGAVVDGSTDDTTALQSSATASAGRILFLTNGDWKVNAQITLPATCKGVLGESAKGVFVDASAASGTFPNGGVFYIAGTATQIEDLGAAAAKHARTVTFDAAPAGITERSVFVIYNPTALTFGSEDPESHAGEWCRVKAVTDAVVDVIEPLWASYETAAVDCYRIDGVTAHFENLRIKQKSSVSGGAGIVISFGVDCSIKNVECWNNPYYGVFLDRCYGTYVEGFRCIDFTAIGTENYGISMANTQNTVIAGCHIHTGRHAIQHGGANLICSVPCRGTRVNDSWLSSEVNHAADWHDNSEGCIFEDCTLIGGAVIRGVGNTLRNCFITSQPGSSGVAIYVPRPFGAGHTIEGNEIHAVSVIGSGFAVVYFEPNEEMERGGTFVLRNNTIKMGTIHGNAIRCYHDGATIEMDVTIEGNTIEGTNAPVPSDLGINIEAPDSVDGGGVPIPRTAFFRSVTIEGNTLYGSRIYLSETDGQLVTIHGNSVIGASEHGITLFATPSAPFNANCVIEVTNNTVTGGTHNGLYLGLDHTTPSFTLICKENTFVRNNTAGATGPDVASIYAANLASAVFEGNTLGSTADVRLMAWDTITALSHKNNHSVIDGIKNVHGRTAVTTEAPGEYFGVGSPEGVVVAPVGSRYYQTNGSTGTTLYVKESGVGVTGWAAK